MTPAEASAPARMAASVDAEEAEPALPASVGASGPAQPPSSGAPRVSASALTCNYLDQGTKSNLAESAWRAGSLRARARGARA